MKSIRLQLYIMTLGCLAPYRRLGIGTKMLEHVLNVVKDDGNFSSIFLHVQINNQSAIEFYQKFGFKVNCLYQGQGTGSEMHINCYPFKQSMYYMLGYIKTTKRSKIS